MAGLLIQTNPPQLSDFRLTDLQAVVGMARMQTLGAALAAEVRLVLA
jgi:hypothetical protein